MIRITGLLAILLTSIFSCSKSQESAKTMIKKENSTKVIKSDEEWRKELTDEEYYVLREKGTERAFTGDLWDNHEKGIYFCAACDYALFSSESKFESGTGWPSFYEPVNQENVEIIKDTTYGMLREEVVCAKCGGHLGHVFQDGPEPTGLRYCINSVSLDFIKEEK